MDARLPMRERFAHLLELPEDALGAPRVTISGRSAVLIENGGGILEYTPTLIRVRAGRRDIRVSGAGLRIRSMDRMALHITGVIDAVAM